MVVRKIETKEGQGQESEEDRKGSLSHENEGLGRIILDALRGRGGSLNEGPLNRAILYLAVPMVLEMVMESVFAVVDIFFVSRLGPEAMATVGLTESLLAIIYTLAMGLSIGVTATVVLGTLGAWHAASLLRLMGADGAVVEEGVWYTRILLGGNGVILLLFLLNAAFRGAGDAAVAMRVLWFGNALNILLDPLLIFGVGPFPELGIRGAAIATTIGRGSAVCLQLLILFRISGRLKLTLAHLRPRLGVIAALIRLSGTGTFQVFVSTASWIGLVRIIAGFGSEALAGYTVAIRIVLFALLPAWGLANAAATLVGQGLGAGKPERAERAVWIAGKMNFLFLGSVGIFFMLFAPGIVGLFSAEGATGVHAIHGLRIISAGFFFYGYGMVLTQAFNGAGDAWTPTWLNLFCFWLWEIPLAWLLAYRVGWGADGVFVAITIAFSTIAVASGVLFKRGKWKKSEV